MSVTLAHIAQRVGTSKMTVSQALRGTGRVAASTRQRILDAALELGYRPNAAAVAVSTGRFGCIAVLMSDQPFRSTLPVATLRGIHDALMEEDLHLTLAMLPDDKLTSEGIVPKILRKWMADGLLINYTHHIPQRMIDLIEEYHLPSVWMNTRRDTDCITLDDFGAARQATEYLIKMGHKSIAWVDYSHSHLEIPTAHYSVTSRIHGYERAMTDASLAPRLSLRPHELAPDGRFAHSLQWLSAPDRPTAVVCYGNHTSIPLMTAALRLGIQVPGELSLVSFDGAQVVNVGPPFTTVLVPEHQMGYEAVRMLLRKLAEPARQLPVRTIGFGFDAGATCAPPA